MKRLGVLALAGALALTTLATTASAQGSGCNIAAVQVRLYDADHAEALRLINICIADEQTSLAAGRGYRLLTAGVLNYNLHVRAQLLALMGDFAAARTALAEANALAVREGFDQRTLLNDAALAIPAATEGIILEREGRAADARRTYERGEVFGRAAELAAEAGDVVSARHLASLDGPLSDNSHIANAMLAEAQGNSAAAVTYYLLARDEMRRIRDAGRNSMPYYYLNAQRAEAALARLGATP